MLVQSSSDDLWFLDEDEEVDQISVELGSEENQPHPHLEEYEVESSSGTSSPLSEENRESFTSTVEVL